MTLPIVKSLPPNSRAIGRITKNAVWDTEWLTDGATKIRFFTHPTGCPDESGLIKSKEFEQTNITSARMIPQHETHMRVTDALLYAVNNNEMSPPWAVEGHLRISVSELKLYDGPAAAVLNRMNFEFEKNSPVIHSMECFHAELTFAKPVKLESPVCLTLILGEWITIPL